MLHNKSSGFFTALSFLSRLGKPVSMKQDYAQGLLWYGSVGAFLGALCSAGALLPVLLSWEKRLPLSILSLLCALLWLSLEIWLSRAIHWDGLADLGDALGSARGGDEFVKILVDSRLGTFGALFLIIIFIWQLLFLACLLYNVLSSSSALPLVFLPVLACAWSRISPLWLAKQAKARPDSFLGKRLCEALTPRCHLCACMQALFVLFIAWLCGMTLTAIVALIFCQSFLLRYLVSIAKKNGGLSGDFFGACIVLSQLSFLACACFGTP